MNEFDSEVNGTIDEETREKINNFARNFANITVNGFLWITTKMIEGVAIGGGVIIATNAYKYFTDGDNTGSTIPTDEV